VRGSVGQQGGLRWPEGASKFVILPTDPVDDVDALHRQLDRIHDELLPLQT
jgi:hypothetical protein